MRGNAHSHEFISLASLDEALLLLVREPNVWTPFAGGTELMVQHSVGRLRAKRLVNISNFDELNFIRESENAIAIGAATTFRALRQSPSIATHFPLLAQASTWIGSIANQSRATIGGNIVNASPAADSPPALLAYDAELEIISAAGSRRIPYIGFHTGYKQNILAPEELLFAIHLPKKFAAHNSYLRKVGTRRALAISKVALALTARISDGILSDVRIGAASLAPFPARMTAAENKLESQPITSATIANVRHALMAEAAPIDDIRSTAEYRKRVAANLLEEALRGWLNERTESSAA